MDVGRFDMTCGESCSRSRGVQQNMGAMTQDIAIAGPNVAETKVGHRLSSEAGVAGYESSTFTLIETGQMLHVGIGHRVLVGFNQFGSDGKEDVTAYGGHTTGSWIMSDLSRKSLLKRTVKVSSYRVGEKRLKVVSVQPFSKPEGLGAPPEPCKMEAAL